MRQTLTFLKKLTKLILGRSSVVDITPLTFNGWKMATGTQVPWHQGGTNQISRSFSRIDDWIANLITKREVHLTQFRIECVDTEVSALKWRHYFVYWTASQACKIPCKIQKNFVELGVCDGLTAWYAVGARIDSQCDGHFYLYDAWEGMRRDLLDPSEKGSEGSYAYLDLENTKRNLARSGATDLVYNKGYIPESFATCANPATVAWLHIDLNSSLPTISALNFFWDSIIPGGIILFDDFAWPGYEATRHEIETWSDEKRIDIMHLPTGQAIVYKN